MFRLEPFKSVINNDLQGVDGPDQNETDVEHSFVPVTPMSVSVIVPENHDCQQVEASIFGSLHE